MVSDVSTHSPNVFMYVLCVAPSVGHHARCFPGPKALQVSFIFLTGRLQIYEEKNSQKLPYIIKFIFNFSIRKQGYE